MASSRRCWTQCMRILTMAFGSKIPTVSVTWEQALGFWINELRTGIGYFNVSQRMHVSFSMVYSLEDAIVVCGRFPTTTRRVMCIARGIEGHAWQGSPIRSNKKSGQDNVHWMVFVMHRTCTTANSDNGLNRIVMMMSCNHIILLCTIDSSWTWCAVYYFWTILSHPFC